MAADARFVAGRQGKRFLLLYALANAGGVAAYLPLLTLLLPTKMAGAAGDLRIEWLAAATLGGAVTASLANIAFGWASDVRGSRRVWVAAGLALTMASYAVLHCATTPTAIVGAVMFYQLALNMMLAPLAAWAADTVPDAQKGLLGGLLGAGHPVGALAGVVATLPFLGGQGMQLAMVCAIVAALIVPLLVIGQAVALPAAAVAPPPTQRTIRRIDLSLLWMARLLVQMAGSVLFAFVLYYFQSLPGRPASEAEVARLSSFTLIAAFPLALILGRASDRIGKRRPFLFGVTVAMSVGLALMGIRPSFGAAVAGYTLFGCGLAIFLALHSAYAMQLLLSPKRRGRDLGLFNLTNTLPALLSPLLAVGLAPTYGFDGLMLTLAALVAVAAALILAVRGEAKAA
ncbi:MAG: MFS transporter [Sphingomicrobium sp.]